MPYNANSLDNLQPFTGKDDSRRQNGRKAGSKNIKSITRELLESDVDLSLPIDEMMKDYLSNNGNRSYIEAITLAMIIRAVNGDVRAANLIFDRNRELGINDEEGVFEKTVLNFHVIPSPCEKPQESEI